MSPFLTVRRNRKHHSDQNQTMIRFRTTLLFLLSAQLASAQAGTQLRQAERYLASGDVYNAAIKYEQFLGIRKSTGGGYAPYTPQKISGAAKATSTKKQQAYAKLAGCYYQLHDYSKAASYYLAAGILTPTDRLQYAVSLRASGRSAEAKSELDALIASKPPEAIYSQAAHERAVLDFPATVDTLFQVYKAAGDVNTGHGNFAAVKSGSVVFFTSSRVDTVAKTKGPNRNHLYRIVGEEALQADPLPGQDTDQGICSFTPDGRRVYFTVWKKINGQNNARIYTCTREDGGWTVPVSLNASVNEAGSSNAQPCFAQVNGKSYIFFSSNRAGGQGNFDIWYAEVDALGNAGSPRNAPVNTAGDEQAPFYHAPSGSLVFSSNGAPGMGGYDLFIANGPFGAWTGAQNAGAPLNSVKDDSYFFSASKDSLFRDAWMSSDRLSDCCYELFRINKSNPPKPVTPQVPPVVTSPDSPAVVAPKPWELPVLLFDFDKDELTEEARIQLDSVADYLVAHPEFNLRLGGYTDSKGADKYNNRLSERRARAAQAYLVQKGILTGRLWIKAFGECCPVATETIDGTDNAEARQRNRRVQLELVIPKHRD
jgi:OOP family OmpA-OmpF porin